MTSLAPIIPAIRRDTFNDPAFLFELKLEGFRTYRLRVYVPIDQTVKVHYRAELGASGVTKVRGSFQLDMRDFDIKAPSYLGVSVAPKVEVSVELALTGSGARPQHAEGGNEVR